MDLTELINLLTHSDNISIEYSNIDGKESLKINGKEIENKESFDDSEIKAKIEKYLKDIESIDDDLFVSVIESIKEINLGEFDDLCKQDSFTEEEAEIVNKDIDFMYNRIKEEIMSKVEQLADLYNKLP